MTLSILYTYTQSMTLYIHIHNSSAWLFDWDLYSKCSLSFVIYTMTSHGFERLWFLFLLSLSSIPLTCLHQMDDNKTIHKWKRKTPLSSTTSSPWDGRQQKMLEEKARFSLFERSQWKPNGRQQTILEFASLLGDFGVNWLRIDDNKTKKKTKQQKN